MPRVSRLLVCFSAMFCMFSLCKKPPVALHTPSTPHEPAGPSTGRADTAYTFQTYSTDPDSDNIRYRISVSGGDTSDWSSWNGSGDTFTFTVTFPGPDTFTVTAQANDPDDSVSAWSEPHVIVISQSPNHAPTSDWTAPDSLDTFLSGIGLFLEVVWAKIAQARVSPPAIIEQLDVLDNRCSGFQSGPEPSLVD